MRSELFFVGFSCFLLAGCGGAAGLYSASERIPGNGGTGGPGEAALKVQQLPTKDWASLTAAKVAPTCAGATIDAKQLEAAKKTMAEWAVYRKAHPRPVQGGVTVGDLAGIPRDFTERIDVIEVACGAGAVLSVNGTPHTFESLYTMTNGTATAPATSVEIMAISMADKKIVYASLTLPTAAEIKQNPKTADAAEVILINNIAAYLPAAPDEPWVHKRDYSSAYEVFVANKGAVEGFYYEVAVFSISLKEPSHYLGVGKYKVAD